MKKSLKLTPQDPYDVIVCGAGHAGCEAALAAARMGASVLLLTGNLDTVAQMSCNPAVGGEGKGHLIREIDALGGEMGVNADLTAIQHRLLNRSKGPAVQSPRAQCDKKAYQLRMKHTLELQPGLTLFQATVDQLLHQQGRVTGVATHLGVCFYGKTIIITAGTFLRGLMHVGSNQTEGGRMGDFAAKGLSASLLDLGIELQRLKTGTPPRILGSSVDFALCEEQTGDADPVYFAFYDTRHEDMFHVEHMAQVRPGWPPGSHLVSCWVTHTTAQTQELVLRNLACSALYGGIIQGVGPRYCPSIEDKFVKFEGKDAHRVFLEPEGLGTDEWYINGLSMSFPLEVQLAVLRSVRGLEQAVMTRPAYAVEYDVASPTQLLPSLESKKAEGLFFAGQINGTTGYAEAAAQGLLAGVNAVLKLRGQSPWVVGRDEAYLGVLVDDLVTKGAQEPYRMFTSRAEHRLLLNHGSAELRLLHHAKQHRLLDPERLLRIEAKAEAVQHWVGVLEAQRHQGVTWGDVLRRQNDMAAPVPEAMPEAFLAQSQSVREEVLYRIRYRGYLEREYRAAERMRDLDAVKIDPRFSYLEARGLRIEARQKLDAVRPLTLGQASRMNGVNPADIQVLWVLLKQFKEAS
jgi:tRNA uridine 5-carboxymethylaminomethyl modification enzyme